MTSPAGPSPIATIYDNPHNVADHERYVEELARRFYEALYPEGLKWPIVPDGLRYWYRVAAQTCLNDMLYDLFDWT